MTSESTNFRVIVGIDFCAPSIAGAKWALRQLVTEENRANLTFVHAVSIPEPPSFLRARYPGLDSLAQSALQGARMRLDELVSSLAAGSVHTEARPGRPVEVLAAVGTERLADIIVVGRHGESRSVRGPLGSTAEALVRTAVAPVLLATAFGETKPRRILAAVDDAPTAGPVLQWAHRLALRFGARVTAVHVMSNAVLSHVLSLRATAYGKTEFTDAEIQEEFQQETERWLRELVSSGFAPGTADSEIAFGSPGAGILGAAERSAADLIVLGSRGAGRVPSLLLGSTVDHVLRDAPCPVFVVPPTDE